MQRKRLAVIVAAAVALVAAVAIATLWIGARTEAARREVASRIGGAIGLPVAIETLRFGVFPTPAIVISGLEVAQPEGFGPEPFLSVGRVRASIPWGSLFGALAIDELAISDVVARLRVDARGESNWSRLFPEPAAGGAAPGRSAWSLGRFGVERGAVEYEDHHTDSRWRLAAIRVEARRLAPAVAFPLELRLGGEFGSNTINYALEGEGTIDPAAGRYVASGLDFRGWAGGEPMPLAGVEFAGTLERASYLSARGVATLESGRITLAGIPGEFGASFNFEAPELEADFLLRTGQFAPRPPAVAFGFPLPATTDPEAFGTMQLSLHGALQNGVLALDPVTGRLDQTSFEARIVPDRRLIQASLDRIDVNRYLPPAAVATEAKPKPRSRRETKETLEEAIAGLAKLDIEAEIRIAEASVAGAKVRDSVIRVDREGSAP